MDIADDYKGDFSLFPSELGCLLALRAAAPNALPALALPFKDFKTLAAPALGSDAEFDAALALLPTQVDGASTITSFCYCGAALDETTCTCCDICGMDIHESCCFATAAGAVNCCARAAC